MKLTIRLKCIGFSVIAVILGGCGKNSNELKIGATAGPQAAILEFVRDHAKRTNKLNIKIMEFNDFIIPNAALDTGYIDANSYQHTPFLEHQIKTRGYKLTPIATTILLPMGIYSDKYDSLNSLSQRMTIGLPNDPTNGGRALLLLERAGLIRLKPRIRNSPSFRDIIDNPLKLKFVELEAPQLPLALADLDFAVINTDWMLVSGRNPDDALFREGSDSPYTNVIVVRTEDKDDPRFQALVESYQSEATKTFIKDKYRSAIIPSFGNITIDSR